VVKPHTPYPILRAPEKLVSRTPERSIVIDKLAENLQRDLSRALGCEVALQRANHDVPRSARSPLRR
jgi:hypothetical protein